MLKTIEEQKIKNQMQQTENKHPNDIRKSSNIHTVNTNEINTPFENRDHQTE